jgi:hypothetical protein
VINPQKAAIDRAIARFEALKDRTHHGSARTAESQIESFFQAKEATYCAHAIAGDLVVELAESAAEWGSAALTDTDRETLRCRDGLDDALFGALQWIEAFAEEHQVEAA